MKIHLPVMVGLWLLFIPFLPKAQYVITPIAPPPTFTFSDLWHFSVINAASDSTSQFYVSLRIFDGSNLLKVKSNTSTFHLGAGSNYYNLSNLSLLQPFTTSYYDASLLQQAISTGGTFPPGTYHLVYTLYGKFADGQFAPLSEDASEAVVEVMWPPMLLSPPDADTIDTQYPILTWTPAFSSAYVGQINYTLNLVELYPGQNSYQAIQANPLYFTQNNIPITMLPYPPAAQILDTTKVYAWQVHADAQGTAMGSSEVWTFRFPSHISINDTITGMYFEVSRLPSSYFVEITDGILRMAFQERLYDVDNKLSFKIYNENNQPIANNTQLTKIINQGFNKISISLCDNSTGFNLPKANYRIEITSQRGDVYKLNFFHNKIFAGCPE